MLALTINIPDGLLSGPFWAGLVIGVIGTIACFMYAFRNFKVF